jgi:hypothetical protein
MILLMTGLVVFALFTGALSFVTGKVALVAAAAIAAWLLLFAARSLHARRAVRRG